MEYLTYKNKEYILNYYLVYKKNQKNTFLKIKNCEVYIYSSNNRKKFIKNFIEDKLDEIKNYIELYNEKKRFELIAKDKFVYILNIKYKIILVDKNINSKIIGFVLYMRNVNNLEKQIKKMYDFLKKKYLYLFLERLDIVSNNMNEKVKIFQLKNMSAKWGICYFNFRKIILNIKLIHFDIALIDYLFIHEISHIKYHYHNYYFWNNVKKFDENYKKHKKIIKNNYFK